ncbi:MAG: hypothetical protein IPI66_13295 [Chitinophagaceae bacterium]|nr:hypothetical protein [Chitinophagaceae bacterium]MBL0056912.1 hypothetical protein [Chitinophagaceae bacterium]
MSFAESIDQSLIRQWIEEKLEPEKVRELLTARGLDHESISIHLKAFRKLRHEKRQFMGFVCMGAGAFLGFISCILSIMNPVPEMYGLFMYGFTSLAILIVFAGLYLVFE